MKIPFNKPFMVGRELEYIERAVHQYLHISGNGRYTELCRKWLEEATGSRAALLTHSCTAALEMSALLLDLQPGDEVILPSFTFVSTANAFALRGAAPVFVDIDPETLNISPEATESAITPRTKAVCVVHYAGIACDMDRIMPIAERHGIAVIEDAAQGIMASYKDKPLGSFGRFAAFSFHETKNIISGEGGALLVNEAEDIGLAEIIWEKGTDRSRLMRGEVDKYTWQHLGSSFLPSELIAAFLWAQLEEAERLTARRLEVWQTYHDRLAPLERQGLLRRPVVPDFARHNAHMYYVLLPSAACRDLVLQEMNAAGVNAVFHYIPLHSSPAGMRLGRAVGELPTTVDASARLIRLPLWMEMGSTEIEHVVNALDNALRRWC